jgi:hypothetical protein
MSTSCGHFLDFGKLQERSLFYEQEQNQAAKANSQLWQEDGASLQATSEGTGHHLHHTRGFAHACMRNVHDILFAI